MTPQQYRTARRVRGSQAQVARALGLDVMTISRRERGEFGAVNREAEIALLSLPEIRAEKTRSRYP
jgi:hypothetical protein